MIQFGWSRTLQLYLIRLEARNTIQISAPIPSERSFDLACTYSYRLTSFFPFLDFPSVPCDCPSSSSSLPPCVPVILPRTGEKCCVHFPGPIVNARPTLRSSPGLSVPMISTDISTSSSTPRLLSSNILFGFKVVVRARARLTRLPACRFFSSNRWCLISFQLEPPTSCSSQ